jgi:hypothetical protein
MCIKSSIHVTWTISLWSEWYCQYQQTYSDTENDWSVWCQMHYDVRIKITIKVSVLKVMTYIITALPVRLITIQVIMSVSTFITDVNLHLTCYWLLDISSSTFYLSIL